MRSAALSILFLAALFVAACASPTAPSPVGANSIAPSDVGTVVSLGRPRPLADAGIHLEVIPPDQATQGWLWLRASYTTNKSGCQTPPEFSITPAGADIYGCPAIGRCGANTDDPFVAYVGGVPGDYVVTAKGCGRIGSLPIHYTGAHP